MVSSRDRILVDVEVGRLNPPQERRRLRFSFHIYNVKDRDRLAGPTVYRPAAARGGYLWGRPVPVNRPFPLFSENEVSEETR